MNLFAINGAKLIIIIKKSKVLFSLNYILFEPVQRKLIQTNQVSELIRIDFPTCDVTLNEIL